MTRGHSSTATVVSRALPRSLSTPATATTSSAKRLQEPTMLKGGKEYLEGLRDGRVVYVGSERIDDVTRHPAFRNGAQTIADLFERKADPANRALLTFEED